MNQVPRIKITQAHLDAANRHFTSQRYASHTEFVNKAIEIALAEQSQEQPLISPVDLSKVQPEWELGSSPFKDWCGKWFGSDSDETYLAKAVLALPIKQPEPVEPTCQVKNLDTGVTETMTLESAEKLFDETSDKCNWSFIYSDSKIPASMREWSPPVFAGIYTYKLKAKPLKQVSWKYVPVGVMTSKGELRALASDLLWCETRKHGCPSLAGYSFNQVELAPSDQQPWIAVQDDQDSTKLYQQLERIGLVIEGGAFVFRITGIAEGYKL